MTNEIKKDERQQDLNVNNRREVIEKLGKFAAYAAPFAVLASTKKAEAATATGPRSKSIHH